MGKKELSTRDVLSAAAGALGALWLKEWYDPLQADNGIVITEGDSAEYDLDKAEDVDGFGNWTVSNNDIQEIENEYRVDLDVSYTDPIVDDILQNNLSSGGSDYLSSGEYQLELPGDSKDLQVRVDWVGVNSAEVDLEYEEPRHIGN